MAANLTERQRIEHLLFIDQLTHVVRDGAKSIKDLETARTLQSLCRARMDAEAGLTQPELGKIERRLRRVDADAFDPVRTMGMAIADFGLVVYCVMRALAEADYLNPVRGSDLAQALDRLLPVLAETAPDDLTAAEAKAARVLQSLQSAGYLVGFRAVDRG